MSKYIGLFFLIIPPLVFSMPNLENLSDSKKTVCSVTINSTEEINTFKSKLNPNDFQFIELTNFFPNQNPGESSRFPTEWFERSCKSGVKCDILIISGHFAGSFFGSSGLSLPIELLGKKSCENSCPGLLNHPKEVFLFGCNTLADKEQDHRTREEYIEVLLEENIPAHQAEQIANARYSTIGTSFKQRMRMAFSNVEHIYGFDSVGPSGKNVKSFLQDYLDKIDDYKLHLDKKVIKEASAFDSNSVNNLLLAEALKITAFTQCSGVFASNNLDDPKIVEKRKLIDLICALNNEDIVLSERVNIILDIIAEDKVIELLPNITEFLNKIRVALKEDNIKNFSDDQIKLVQKTFNESLDPLRNNLAFKNFLETIVRNDSSLNLRVKTLGIQELLGYISKEDFSHQLRNEFEKIFPPKNRFEAESLVILSSLKILEDIKLTMPEAKVNKNSSNYHLMALSVLPLKHLGDEFVLHLLESAPSNNGAGFYTNNIIQTLVEPENTELIHKLITIVENEKFDLNEYLNSMTGTSPEITKSVEKIRSLIIEYPELKLQIKEQIRSESVSSRLEFLNKIKPKDPSIKEKVRKLVPDFEFSDW